ncbi:Acyl-CoA dehydrogenase [Albimonas donghaensis]|uniref:Acyl-CoA dehydrogenase n=1 Tax=Albimonas donghaensis TaxID=356660 RepID=A0A1H3BZX3_9RHOB|nr:acyl-CoA dehydrogenase family protein [Albimonas donghaensis]SDX47502.1 Acyl-CoA dehydrogenase [Albimonas donghaensis]
MDLTFTDEQVMLRDSLGKYLERNYDFETRRAVVAASGGHDPKIWADLAEMGLMALTLPEDRGGLGGSVVDLVAVAEVMGAKLLAEPWLPALPGALALAHGGAGEGGAAALAAFAEGGAPIAFAHEEGRALAEPARVAMTATRKGGELILSGAKRYVVAAEIATHLVVSARVSGAPGARAGIVVALVARDAPGVTLDAYDTVDGRRGANIRFEAVRVPAADVLADEDAGCDLLNAALAPTVLALCADAVGAMGALVKITARYAADRKQFGVPIGSFQALRHRIADMAMAHQKARSTLIVTTAMAEAGACAPRDLRLLKAQVGRMGREVGESAVQVHGGVGMTDELSVGHYFKRLLAMDAIYGAGRLHFRAIGAAA